MALIKWGGFMNKKLISRITGIICLVVTFALIFTLGVPTMKEKRISFDSTYKNEPVSLKGSYYEAQGAEYAALICPGYSCDRQKWRPMANVFAKNGISVMTFDYAGQGASSDTIGFDNAKTDSIPAEIGDAIEKLHSISGIDYDHIILVGHSMGGRSILRLLYDYNDPTAETTVTKRDISNVILMSPEVNYNFNAQASLFAGTSDDAEEPWHSYNETLTKGTNIYLYGSTADDIVSEGDIYAIYNHIGGKDTPTEGKWSSTQVNGVGSKITVGVTSGVLHSYMMYSPRCTALVNGAIEDITGKASTFAPAEISFVYISWIMGLLGLALVFVSLKSEKNVTDEDELPVITDSKKFLFRKLLMWLPGLLAAFVICCICVVMPFGSPVMNIPYMCCIAGYGIVMIFAYRKGKFKGTEGKLPRLNIKSLADGKTAAVITAVTVILCFYVWFILRGTMYRLIPVNARLFWVIFATVLMAAGYYVSGCENDMLKKSNVSAKTVFLYNLIQYVALFLLIAFYLVIKSYSGVIGQAQNMIFMYIFCVPLGDYIRRKTGNRFIGAAVSAFSFQTFMITSAALISFF